MRLWTEDCQICIPALSSLATLSWISSPIAGLGLLFQLQLYYYYLGALKTIVGSSITMCKMNYLHLSSL
jgi:hypothetical protein